MKKLENKKRHINWDKVCSSLHYFNHGRIGGKNFEKVDNKLYL